MSGTGGNTSPLLRPEVLAAQQRAGEMRAEADGAEAWAAWWASLEDHQHEGEFCDSQKCYQSWAEYPDG